MRKLKKLVRKNKKLLLRLLAFGVALEVVLMTALLLDIPRTSQELIAAVEIGSAKDAQLAKDLGEQSSEEMVTGADEEELTGAGLDDSIYIDPVDPAEGGEIVLDETVPGPEPYDWGGEPIPSLGDISGALPAPEDFGTGGSGYDNGYPAPDDGEGEIGADLDDDYGDTAGCDGDCDEDSLPDPTALPPITVPVVPTPISQPTQAPPSQPTVAPTQAAPTQAAPQPTATNPPPAAPPPTGGLVAVPAAGAPVLDGAGSEAAWAYAPETIIETTGGANESAARVSIRAVYDSQRVYFLMTWEDPTNSWLRNPWEKQPDGSWKRLIGSENEGNDENQYYEDKLALLWPVNDSISGFDTEGCGTACHLGEGGDEKPLGSMHTDDRDELADLWNWKSWRNIGQIDDLYLNSDDYKDDYWAGFQKDPSDGGGYYNNNAKDGEKPAYMPPGGGMKNGWPGLIYAPEKVTLDDALFQPGDRVASVIAEPFLGDRGDILAGWTHVDGRWTIEFSRALVTESRYDVQFDDLSQVYYFALATFDNTQIRHAVQAGATPFRFQK